MVENKDYLSQQIITYLGNKRSLIPFIEKEIKNILKLEKKDKVVTLDLFSGSGVVARMLKQYSSLLYTNDLENYSKLINDVYLMNFSDFDENIYNTYLKQINDRLSFGNLIKKIISY